MTITASDVKSHIKPTTGELQTFSQPVTGGTLYHAVLSDGSTNQKSNAVTFVSSGVTPAKRNMELSWRGRNAAGTSLVSTSPGATDFTITCTPGTSNYLAGHSAQNNTKTDTVAFEMQLADSYVAGTNLTILVNANYTGTGTAGTATVAAAAYAEANDGTQGATLVTTAAQAITGTAGDKTHTINGATLNPGDKLMFTLTTSVQETGNVNPLIGRINSVRIG